MPPGLRPIVCLFVGSFIMLCIGEMGGSTTSVRDKKSRNLHTKYIYIYTHTHHPVQELHRRLHHRPGQGPVPAAAPISASNSAVVPKALELPVVCRFCARSNPLIKPKPVDHD